MMAITQTQPDGDEARALAQLRFTSCHGNPIHLELWGDNAGDGGLSLMLVGELEGLSRCELAWTITNYVRPVMQAIIAGLNEVISDYAEQQKGITMDQVKLAASIAADEAMAHYGW